MGKQPGVMFYFEIRPCLGRLTPEEKGVLFEAILDYGQFGREPELAGGPGVAWDFIRPKLDLDRERYEQICQKRTAAVQARWDRVRAEQGQLEQAGTNAYKSVPNSNSNSISISNSIPISANNPAAAVQPCGKLHAAKAPDAPQGQLCGKLHHGEGPGPDLPCGKLQGDEASPAGAGRPLPGGGEGFTPPGPAPEGDFNARRRQALAALADWARREGGTPP